MNVTEYKQIIRNEHSEVVDLVYYLKDLVNKGKVLNFTKVPNETFTQSRYQKLKNITEGVNPGFPDYIIVTTKEMIFIEMKRLKGGKVSYFQERWHEIINQVGMKVKVCRGFDEAKQFLDEVCGGEK